MVPSQIKTPILAAVMVGIVLVAAPAAARTPEASRACRRGG